MTKRQLLSLRQCIHLLTLTAACMLLTACSSNTFNVHVAMDKSMQTASGIYPSFEVDFIAVNQTEAPRLAAFTVDQYFQADNVYRQNAEKYTMKFSDEHQGPFVLKEDDPIWQKWLARGTDQLVVLSNLPGIWKGKAGKADGRRLALPLNTDRWPNGNDIKLQVNPSGIILMSPLNPIAKK